MQNYNLSKSRQIDFDKQWICKVTHYEKKIKNSYRKKWRIKCQILNQNEYSKTLKTVAYTWDDNFIHGNLFQLTSIFYSSFFPLWVLDFLIVMCDFAYPLLVKIRLSGFWQIVMLHYTSSHHKIWYILKSLNDKSFSNILWYVSTRSGMMRTGKQVVPIPTLPHPNKPH